MDERQILLEAKDLISQQQYEAARRLLRPIAHQPTAQKWLETLDKIAPPPPPERIWDDEPAELYEMIEDDPFAEPPLIENPPPSPVHSTPLTYDQMTAEEKFRRVSLLIKAKNYDEARTILLTVADDPAAQQLLARLDGKRPTTPPPELSAFAKTAFTPPTYGRPLSKPLPRPKPADLPFGKPTHPSALFAAIMMFALAAMPMLAFNWRRFGKPQWVMPSLGVGIGLVIAFLATLLLQLGAGSIWAFVPTVVVVAIFHAYLLVMYYMQAKAYEHYSKRGDVEGMLNHHYQWGRVMLAIGGLTALAVAMVIVFSIDNEAPPTPVDSPYLQLERPNDWHVAPANESEFCNDYAQGCFLYLRHNDLNDVGMAMAYYPLNGATPDAMATYLWGTYMAWYPGLPFGAQSVLTIEQHPVIFQEFTFPNRYSMDSRQVHDYAVARGYVTAEGGLGVIEITFWSADASQFPAVYDDFEAIIKSIDLKGTP